jgi:hypothetical protein
VFTGQGTSQIQIDYSTVPTGTSSVAICVEIKCGNRSTKNCIKVAVCKPQPVTEEFMKGEDALLHFLPASCSTNYGAQKANMISNWTYQGTPAIVSAVIKFSLPSIPAANVTYAELRLTEYVELPQTHATLYGTSPGVETTQSALWIKRILNQVIKFRFQIMVEVQTILIHPVSPLLLW